MKTQTKLIVASAAFIAAIAGQASAQNTASWTRWTSTGPSIVDGTLATNGGPVAVTYTGEIFFTQINNTGTNFWQPDSPYIGPVLANGPDVTDIITIIGGNQTVNRVHFSQPVLNPIFAILSLGQSGLTITYNFDTPFTILSDGPGFFGGPGTLQLAGNATLTGTEGHGAILFPGMIQDISWTVPTAETWHGFTVGILPTPGAAALLGLGGFAAMRRRR